MLFKPVRKYRPIRIKRDPKTNPVWNTREYGDTEEYPGKYCIEELLPMAQERTIDALEVIAPECYLYRKLRTGRKCSCAQTDEYNPPSMDCPVCFGTGIVGGWNKEGCWIEVLDVTYPDKKIHHAAIDTEGQPNRFVGSVLGDSYVVFTVSIPNGLKVDALKVSPEESEVLIAEHGSDSWEVVTKEVLGNYLGQKVDIKVNIPKGKEFICVYIRIMIDDLRFRVEIDNPTKAIAAGEFQLPDLADAIQANFDPRMPEPGTDDFIEIVGKGPTHRFRIMDLTIKKLAGVCLGYEGTIRPITELEVMTLIP